MLLHIEATVIVLVGQVDHILQQRRRHREIVKAALKLLLHVLIHAADPQVQLTGGEM